MCIFFIVQNKSQIAFGLWQHFHSIRNLGRIGSTPIPNARSNVLVNTIVKDLNEYPNHMHKTNGLLAAFHNEPPLSHEIDCTDEEHELEEWTLVSIPAFSAKLSNKFTDCSKI